MDADIRITCNSAVKNLDWLVALDPTVITFSDPIYHFGPALYAAKFREDMLRAVEATSAMLAVPRGAAAVLAAHHPSLVDRLILLDLVDRDWHWPSLDDPSIRKTGNALTNSMLPLAFALADEIHIAGCDGRKPEETFFWQHNKAIQYDDDLMNTLAIAHPSWFRDRKYDSYYAHHCDEVEEFIQVAERAGKQVQSVSTSYIPALAHRSKAGPVSPR